MCYFVLFLAFKVSYFRRDIFFDSIVLLHVHLKHSQNILNVCFVHAQVKSYDIDTENLIVTFYILFCSVIEARSYIINIMFLVLHTFNASIRTLTTPQFKLPSHFFILSYIILLNIVICFSLIHLALSTKHLFYILLEFKRRYKEQGFL